MKKLFALLTAFALTACGHDNNPYPQAQYQQPAPVVVQQAPAQAPVIVQNDSHEGTAMVAGAALGAAAALALSDRGPGYQQAPTYSQPAAVQQNVTHVTQVNKTVIVHNGDKIVNNGVDPKSPPATPPAAAPAPAPTPAPPAPAAPSVNLAKDIPTAKPNYAAAGTQTPVPSMSQAALTAPKTLNMPTPSAAPAPSYKPTNYAQISYNKPAALPAPAPAPKPAAPAPLKLSYSPPKASSSSYGYKPYGKK
jgi:outer membrane lipoprotein SlyB